jgi:hypothetical protein
VAYWGAKEGFITAGHVAEKANTVFYQPRYSKLNNWEVGVTAVVSEYAKMARTDSAFLDKDPESVEMNAGSIWKGTEESYTVTGPAPAPELDQVVFMQGAAMLKEQGGQIAAVDVTVKFEDGGVLEKQCLATYTSKEGDSGAPVYRKADDSNVELIGLNVGVTDADHVTPKPPAGTYAVISLWENIASELHVELKKGGA